MTKRVFLKSNKDKEKPVMIEAQAQERARQSLSWPGSMKDSLILIRNVTYYTNHEH